MRIIWNSFEAYWWSPTNMEDVSEAKPWPSWTDRWSSAFSRLDEFKVWASDPNSIDGYICENILPGGPSPSSVISKYFGKPMYLIYKGSIPRAIKPTTNFPLLTGAAALQDGYPLLVLSEESTTLVEEELSGHIGTQGITEIWRTNKVAIERYVKSFFRLLF